MSTTSGFSTSYGDTPWEDFSRNQYTKYVPELLEQFRHKSLYYGIVNYGVNLAAMATKKMVFTQVIDPEPNIASLDNRAIWLPQLYLDSRQLEITCSRYGDKVMLNKYDEMITYWRENGTQGLRNIIGSRLAPHMVKSLDLLARNAFLDSDRAMFAGDASSFGTLESGDTFDLGVCRAVQLGADYQPDPANNPIFGIVSPSAVYSVRDDDDGEFISRLKYTDNRRMLNYEVGEYEGVRMARHPTNVLWNCGEVQAQTTIEASITEGDGSTASSVRGVWTVGQSGNTNYITVEDTTGFAAGQIVSLHVHRAGDGGTYDSELNAKFKTTEGTNGALFNDPTKIEREIYEVVDGTKLSFTEPITTDDFQTDLSGAGSAYYGYVTYARPVHASVFIKGPRCVVSGVLQPPQTYNPRPVDDTESIWRFSWDAYMKYQRMYPSRYDLYFHAGPVRQLDQVTNI